MINILTHFKKTAFISSIFTPRFLTIGMNQNIMSPEEYLKMFTAVASSPVGYLPIWNFYKSNWEFFRSTYSTSNQEFARLIISVTSRFCETNNMFDVR